MSTHTKHVVVAWTEVQHYGGNAGHVVAYAATWVLHGTAADEAKARAWVAADHPEHGHVFVEPDGMTMAEARARAKAAHTFDGVSS